MSDFIAKRWVVTETFRDDGESEVTATPFNWIKNNILFWPPDKSNKGIEAKLKSCAEPKKGWKEFKNFVIMNDEQYFESFLEAYEKQEEILAIRDTTAGEFSDEGSQSSREEVVVKTNFNNFNQAAENLISDELNQPPLLLFDERIEVQSSDSAPLLISRVEDVTASSKYPENLTLNAAPALGNQSLSTLTTSLPNSHFVLNMQSGQDQLNTILTNQHTIINLLSNLYVNQQNLQSEVTEIKSCLSVLEGLMTKEPDEDVFSFSDFPLKTEEALRDFNSKLADPKYNNLMAASLKFSCGSCKVTTQLNINNMLEKLVSDTLQVEYSALGLRGKKAFDQYSAICELICKALCLTYKGSDPNFKESVKDIMPKIGVCLKHAPGRIIRSVARKNAANPKENSDANDATIEEPVNDLI